MEENNRKGPGVFYAVVGVATLVVAIIGATFAYFSASAEPAAGTNPTGQTINVSATDLSVTVEKITFNGATVDNNNLAPALVGTNGIADPSALTAAQVQSMLNARCEEANKYTGCHVWKITATNGNTQDAISHANLWLGLTTTAANKDQWGYAVFTTNGNVATAGTTALADVAYPTVAGGSNHAAIGNGISNVDIHNDAALNANSSVVYYLMVYLNDNKAVQNDGVTADTTNAVGSYSGTISLDAMGGQVRASFAA